MKKKLAIILSLLLIICFISFYIYKVSNNLELANIKLINYDKANDTITLKIDRVLNFINHDFTCHAKGVKSSFKEKGQNKSCELTIPKDDTYEIFLTNKSGVRTKIIKLNDTLSEVLYFTFGNEKIYIVIGEEKEIKYNDITIGKNINYNFKSSDENVAKVVDNKIVGIASGTATITANNRDEKLTVIVTDLITKPYAIKDKKELLTCHAYTEEEASLLDDILAYKVNEGGLLNKRWCRSCC